MKFDHEGDYVLTGEYPYKWTDEEWERVQYRRTYGRTTYLVLEIKPVPLMRRKDATPEGHRGHIWKVGLGDVCALERDNGWWLYYRTKEKRTWNWLATFRDETHALLFLGALSSPDSMTQPSVSDTE